MLEVYLASCTPESAYLAETSLNEIVDYENADGESLVEVGELVPDLSPSIDELIEQEELGEQVNTFVSQLKPSLRCIAWRRYWQDQPSVDIARDMGVSPSAISHALRRINELGRRSLGPAFAS